jgi:hypothetical protein
MSKPGDLDAMCADPDHHVILLENEHVRVLDARVRDFVRYDPEG